MKDETGKSKSKGAQAKQKTKKSAGFKIGDEPVGGSTVPLEAHKYDLGVEEPEQADPDMPAYEDLGELPQGYGTNHLYLIAKDPQWLFIYWDVNWSEYASEIRSGKVFLRIVDEGGNEDQRIAINPYANNWYVPVGREGATYCSELGYEDEDGGWQVICTSRTAEVPSSAVSADEDALFAKVPLHISFEHLLSTVKSAMQDGESLMEVLARLQRDGASFGGLLKPEWSDERKRILEALLGPEAVSQIGMDSGAIDKLLNKQLGENLSSLPSSESAAKLGALAESGPTSLSSGFGASWSAQPFSEKQERGFFMHVNAEVIFYGGTDPDARVWVDGEEIQLEPDGTFSYHYKFPDGKYEIPIVAQSPDGQEERSATLVFKRDTSRKGDVGHTGQPSYLGIPTGKKK